MQETKLKWLEPPAKGPASVTFGVPWEKKSQSTAGPFALTDRTGREYPVQSWPTAWWPDGSVKWTAHAAVVDPAGAPYRLRADEQAPAGAVSLKVERLLDGLRVDTGRIVCQIGGAGRDVIRSVEMDGKTVCTGAWLAAVRLMREEDGAVSRRASSVSFIEGAELEQEGPLRCVIKVRGNHRPPDGGNGWLPFTLRLTFFAGTAEIRISHTFIYDGDPQRDFIQGIGLICRLPLEGPAYNRHAGFAGGSGLFSEAAELLSTWHPRIPTELYRRQIAGETLRITPDGQPEAAHVTGRLPVWGSYRLVQDSADHYSIAKRTKPGCCWVDATHGGRAAGLAFAASSAGCLAAGLEDFWEKYPRSAQIDGMAGDSAELKLWLWSPEGPAMDLRHYDTGTYVETYYEGFDEMRATPYGIANTNQLTLWCFGGMPEREQLMECARRTRRRPQLVCPPETYRRRGAFGVWSLPDGRTPTRDFLEKQLDACARFYLDEIEQRRWYGFWDYGDVMHTYDDTRHCWKYDMGGYAWQNTELMPTMWLWLMFLRSGRADIYHMARAMTRHSAEVDVYHIGEYAGLGSRHNVRHWGCGCKEARISMAAHSRYEYYLSGDERLGELMDAEKDADRALLHLDPMRHYYPKGDFPTHARTGPDWAAFCSNWMTRWERFRDDRYRDKIRTGIECLKKMPLRLISGSTFGYDPATGKLSFFTEEPGGHLMICQGAPEIWMELCPMIEDPVWENMLAEYGRFYMLSPEQRVARSGLAVKGKGFSFPFFAASMAAFAAVHDRDAGLADKVWRILLAECPDRRMGILSGRKPVPAEDAPERTTELPGVTTNTIAQWALNVIQCLELIGDRLDAPGGPTMPDAGEAHACR